MKISVDSKNVEKLLLKNSQVASQVIDKAFNYFVSITPKDTGNARRNTNLDKANLTIEADYPYAYRLDNGWSRQFGGKGMSKPTIKELDRWVREELRK
jgi:hypothetical protein